MANATSYIYAGSAHITTNSTHMGGVFRRAVGGDHWQALTNGLLKKLRCGLLPSTRKTRRWSTSAHSTGRIAAQTVVIWEKLGFPDLGMVVWSIPV